jgi:hypothetical protein
MKRITYSGGSFLTSDEIADELMSLTAELGRINSADTVEIPVISDSGGIELMELVLGPASQLTSRSELSPFDDPADSESLTHLRDRIALLGPARPVSETTPAAVGTFDEFGEL